MTSISYKKEALAYTYRGLREEKGAVGEELIIQRFFPEGGFMRKSTIV